MTEQSPEQEHFISFSHVGISFDGRPVLEDVSFYVDRGQTLCILGRSGVGKSVALRMLMGFLTPDAGSIRVDGQEITVLERRGHAGHPQAHHHGLPERRPLRFPERARKRGLSPARTRRHGRGRDSWSRWTGSSAWWAPRTWLDALPASLSTGRKRAVAIARALAAKPEVVLYDEPTTMVDPIIARLLGDLIQRLKRQLRFTSIVVTHDTRFAERLADLVLFLHQGRAQYFGPLQGFLASSDPDIQQFLALDAYTLPSE